MANMAFCNLMKIRLYADETVNQPKSQLLIDVSWTVCTLCITKSNITGSEWYIDKNKKESWTRIVEYYIWYAPQFVLIFLANMAFCNFMKSNSYSDKLLIKPKANRSLMLTEQLLHCA